MIHQFVLTKNQYGAYHYICENCQIPKMTIDHYDIIACKKKSMFEKVIEKIKSKPATQEEVDQLKLEAQKAELKARIKKAKNKGKSAKDLSFFIGSSSQPVYKTPSRKAKPKKEKKRARNQSHEIDRSIVFQRPSNRDYESVIGRNRKFRL